MPPPAVTRPVCAAGPGGTGGETAALLADADFPSLWPLSICNTTHIILRKAALVKPSIVTPISLQGPRGATIGKYSLLQDLGYRRKSWRSGGNFDLQDQPSQPGNRQSPFVQLLDKRSNGFPLAHIAPGGAGHSDGTRLGVFHQSSHPLTPFAQSPNTSILTTQKPRGSTRARGDGQGGGGHPGSRYHSTPPAHRQGPS